MTDGRPRAAVETARRARQRRFGVLLVDWWVLGEEALEAARELLGRLGGPEVAAALGRADVAQVAVGALEPLARRRRTLLAGGGDRGRHRHPAARWGRGRRV